MQEPKVGQRYIIFFKGERHGRVQLPVEAVRTEDGWQVEGYLSPEILATVYKWEPVKEDEATS